jgi:co-chaperonin GroES (HSP10)
MHYIRFLKSPRLLLNSPPVLSAKVTVTTDLGESFLHTDIALFVELESEDGSNILGPGKGREYMWKGRSGVRSLEVSIPIPLSKSKGRGGGRMRMLVRPKEDKHSVDTLGLLLTGNNNPNEDEGRVLAVRSMSLDNGQPAEGQNAGVGMAKRVLISGSKEVVVWEETGESIARHIWYDWTGTSTFSSI